MDKKIIIYVLAALIVTALFFGFASNQARPKEIHNHFDFRLVADGKPLDLSQEKYQSTPEHPYSERIHLHDGNGEVVHVHAAGATLDEFLNSMGIELPVAGETKVFVNGDREPRGLAYQPHDLDQILVVHGQATDEQIVAWQAAVTYDACIYSEKCPERGKPPTETCVGQCKV